MRHSDDIKPTCSVIPMWEVAHSTPFDLAAEEWPSEQVTAKAVCLKNAYGSKMPEPLTVLRRLSLRGGSYGCSSYLRWLDPLFKTPTKRYDLFRRRRFFWRKFTFNLDLFLYVCGVSSHYFLYLQFCHRLFSHVAAWPKVGDRPHDAIAPHQNGNT